MKVPVLVSGSSITLTPLPPNGVYSAWQRSQHTNIPLIFHYHKLSDGKVGQLMPEWRLAADRYAEWRLAADRYVVLCSYMCLQLSQRCFRCINR